MPEPCKVCEKPGNGIHYGVWVCESCKCFFRRDVRGQFCDKKCDVTEEMRIICKYCRFQKCLEVGMTRNTRRGRLAQRPTTPNDIVSRWPSDSQIVELMGDEVLQKEPSDSLKIKNIVDSYKEGCFFTSDKFDSFELKNVEIENSGNYDADQIKAWTCYTKEFDADSKALLRFLASLQDSFSSEDKTILFKRSAFQLFLLRRVRALYTDGLLMSDGRIMNTSDLQFLYGIELAEEMLKLVNKVSQLECTDEDLAMFSTIIYYKPGQPADLAHLAHLQNPENLNSAYQKFKHLFIKHAENQYDDPRVILELIKLLPEFDRLKVLHQERLLVLEQYISSFPEDPFFIAVHDLISKINTVQTGSNLPSIPPANRSP